MNTARVAVALVLGMLGAHCAGGTPADGPDGAHADHAVIDATGARDAAHADAAATDGALDSSPSRDDVVAAADHAGPVDGAVFVPIPGVHVPLPIDPVVEIQDNQWLLDVYRTVLGREHDAGGYRVNYAALQSGTTREQITAAFTGSAEFSGNAALVSRDGYITRLYQVLLRRTPGAAEVAAQVAMLRNADGSGAGITWEQMHEAFYASAEYKAVNCQTGYYTLGAPVNPGALLLEDLFNGHARMQRTTESEAVALTLPSAVAQWDQKLPVMLNPQGTGYIGFTRVNVVASPQQFTIALLSSPDAVHFTEVGTVFDRTGNQTFYDPHVAVDNGVCPPRYVMAMECLGREAASLCTSESTTPGWAETWHRPIVSVDGCNGGGARSVCGSAAAQSASTGVTLTDGRARYVAWTQVYDGVGASDPQAHTYSQDTSVFSFDAYQGSVMGAAAPIATLLSATPMPWCTGAWDCNNRDKQDWKREGDHVYALYNGANYYRCDGSWGVSVARSTAVSGGEYTDRLPLSNGIAAERTDTCGISYPMLNVIGGELYVYYAYYPAAGGNRTMRARLVATP